MASKSQSKPAAKTPAAAQTSVDPRETGPTTTTPSSDADTDVAPRKKRVAEVIDEMVTVAVPKAFRLLTDVGVHDYPAGIYEMLRSHAEHWYAQHFGVEIKD